MDMVAALQNQVNNLQQERAILFQATAIGAIPIRQEGTLPLPDDDEYMDPSAINARRLGEL
jgi:hypothetical protein